MANVWHNDKPRFPHRLLRAATNNDAFSSIETTENESMQFFLY